jgi:transmembrane sensor
LVFDATPLGQAVDEINRYSTRKLRLATPARADDVISGSFKTGDTAAFAKAASAMLGLSVEQREDGGMTLREMAHPKG